MHSQYAVVFQIVAYKKSVVELCLNSQFDVLILFLFLKYARQVSACGLYTAAHILALLISKGSKMVDKIL